MTKAQALKVNTVTAKNAASIIGALKGKMTQSEKDMYIAGRLLALAKDSANRKAGKASKLYVNRRPSALPRKIRAVAVKLAEVATEMRQAE